MKAKLRKERKKGRGSRPRGIRKSLLLCPRDQGTGKNREKSPGLKNRANRKKGTDTRKKMLGRRPEGKGGGPCKVATK